MPRNIRTLIVVPENNTTMEPEIAALCPALAPIPVAPSSRISPPEPVAAPGQGAMAVG